MLTSFALTALLLAAPAQEPAKETPPPVRTAPILVGPNVAPGAFQAEPAPRILEIKPDPDGKVRVMVLRPKAPAPIGVAPGVARPAIMRIAFERVELTEVKDLKVATVGGKEIKTEDAIAMLAKGGTVVIPVDGKAIPANFLKIFKDDVLILTSPELVQRGNAVTIIAPVPANK